MEVKFAYTILYVNDVERTIKFYQEALGFKQKFITPEKDYAELISGSTTLSFASIELGKSNFQQPFEVSSSTHTPFGMELAFTTAEVDEVMEKALSCGASLLQKTVEKPWGQKVGYIRDLNGFILEICTPITT